MSGASSATEAGGVIVVVTYVVLTCLSFYKAVIGAPMPSPQQLWMACAVTFALAAELTWRKLR